MSRLSLSDTDKQARDWFAATTQSLGCKVTTDAMGNQFAIRPGLNDGPATCTGSHLDTQPSGGRYDGILGITAGVEMLRALNDNWVETTYPVGVINWTNEEGARFPKSMVASGVWAGSISLEDAHNLKSVIPAGDTATMGSELERIGYLGTTACSWDAMPIAAHFELHIEQGPILEAEQRKVGIVRGVQAYKWFTLTVSGRDSHTGATSFQHRADALLTASKMILASHRIATRHGALASTGILNLRPGSTNTVPGWVQFSLDVRSPKDETVEAVEKDCKAAFAAIAAGEDVEGVNAGCAPSERFCSVEWRTDFVSPATNFHEDCIKCRSCGWELGRLGQDDDQRSRPRLGVCQHASPGQHDICALQRWCQPQSGGVYESGGLREWSADAAGVGAEVRSDADVEGAVSGLCGILSSTLFKSQSRDLMSVSASVDSSKRVHSFTSRTP
jgi:hydantoinase/carbamoylase family amidase